MALEFSEAEIVKRVIGSTDLYEHCLLRRWPDKYKLAFKLEAGLRSGKRMDAFFMSPRGRFAWVIEFKVHAKPDSLVQILKYAREVTTVVQYDKIETHGYRKIFGVQKTIIAQSFDDDVIFLASRLSVQVLQFNPISNRIFELRPMVAAEKHPRYFRLKFEAIPDVEFA